MLGVAAGCYISHPSHNKKPAANRPAMVTRIWMRLVAKFWTLEMSGVARAGVADKSTINCENQRERRRGIKPSFSPPKEGCDQASLN